MVPRKNSSRRGSLLIPGRQREIMKQMLRIVCGGLILLAAALSLCGCSQTRTQQRPTNKVRLETPKAAALRVWDLNTSEEVKVARGSSQEDQLLDERARAHAHYAAGLIHEMNEDEDAALEEYHLSALHDPANESLLLDVTRRFLQKKQPEKALA